ncbi:hypothetical protein BDV06DRAFT_228600 [Aspergillus oleicola]
MSRESHQFREPSFDRRPYSRDLHYLDVQVESTRDSDASASASSTPASASPWAAQSDIQVVYEQQPDSYGIDVPMDTDPDADGIGTGIGGTDALAGGNWDPAYGVLGVESAQQQQPQQQQPQDPAPRPESVEHPHPHPHPQPPAETQQTGGNDVQVVIDKPADDNMFQPNPDGPNVYRASPRVDPDRDREGQRDIQPSRETPGNLEGVDTSNLDQSMASEMLDQRQEERAAGELGQSQTEAGDGAAQQQQETQQQGTNQQGPNQYDTRLQRTDNPEESRKRYGGTTSEPRKRRKSTGGSRWGGGK